MSWEEADNIAKSVGSGGGIFIKLVDDKETITGAFVGEPVVLQRIWTGSGFETYDKEVHKEERPRTEFRFNFYVPGDGMKIIAGGKRWFETVKMMRDKYGLDKKLIEITRQGKKGDTNTTYAMLPAGDIDANLKKEIEACDLHQLDPNQAGW